MSGTAVDGDLEKLTQLAETTTAVERRDLTIALNTVYDALSKAEKAAPAAKAPAGDNKPGMSVAEMMAAARGTAGTAPAAKKEDAPAKAAPAPAPSPAATPTEGDAV